MEENNTKLNRCKKICSGRGTPSGAVYGLGLVGAAIYYISTATSFWLGVFGLLKALVWPALLVYEIMKYFLM